MPTSRTVRCVRLLLLALVGCAVVVGLAPLVTHAHNTLVSSEPADGASLDEPPSEVSFTFDRSVPLETTTITLIDAAGVRTQLSGSRHGPTGDSQVVTPLPTLSPGVVSVRWRLVGADGHAVTGRVQFSITGPPEGAADVDDPVVAVPPPVVIDPADDAEEAFGQFVTPPALRWVLRYASYLAIMAVVGVLVTSAVVWPGAAADPLLRRVVGVGLLATAALAFVQLLVSASDIAAAPPWSAVGQIDPALTTNAGMAFAVRIVLALTMGLVFFRAEPVDAEVGRGAMSILGLGLLGTWAFAGHAASMRWPTLGVLADVAHHAAAATWIAGLAIVAWIVIPRARPDELIATMRRFSTVAAVSVAVLVVTGVVQGVRLVGNPTRLLEAGHGRYLAAKVGIVAVMLVLGNINRRRVERRLDDPVTVRDQAVPLRRAMLAEFAIGLVIVAVTAAMVVAPPSAELAQGQGPTSAGREPGIYYAAS